jgi:Domain of unknown function (DUF5122) beta-propeller
MFGWMLRRTLGTMAIAVAVGLSLSAAASGAGRLDGTLGGSGRGQSLRSQVPGYEFQSHSPMAVGPDDAIYLVERPFRCPATGCEAALIVTRYRQDGTLDRRFGNDGHALVLSFPGGSSEGELGEFAAVEVDSHGRATVAETTESRLVVARLLTDGSLDPGFGTAGGQVSIPWGPRMRPSLVTLEQSGEVEIIGKTEGEITEPSGTTARVEVTRLSAVGQL